MIYQCPKCHNTWNSSAIATQLKCLLCKTEGVRITGKDLTDLRRKQLSTEKRNRRLILR